MATIILSAIGAATGASVGGGVLGLSSVVLGRAIGATIGRAIDQSVMGAGSQAVEHGKVDRFRLTGASEGVPLGQVYGRMRVGGQVIWATRFQENTATSGGGKSTSSGPKTTEYSYSISLAIALCEGEITRVGRIWADGNEIAPADLNMRVYTGAMDQDPDPKIEAVEGAGMAPAYRGTAYMMLEDLDLSQFGNRIPQLTFEVFRPTQPVSDEAGITRTINAVAMIPGTGEYALATTPVYYDGGPGEKRAANLATPSGQSDFATSLEALRDELPNCGSASLVVSWFGNDLRCGSCDVAPKVEQAAQDGDTMPWVVSGASRAAAPLVPQDGNGASVYGGTPADSSVVEAIQALQSAGKEVMFYPFILMDQLDGNGLVDPYSGGSDQPPLPWRGRITASLAPGQSGSPDGTATADAEVASFFGAAQISDFTISGEAVSYSGPAEWSFRRMILHYAHLCVAAGGVEAFCIGSEMRGLTQIRGASGFPAVQELIALASDVRAIVGSACKISYAADWSEYFGYQPPDGSGDIYYHLDPLWADANIDFIGIDNYMPLSDWRDGEDHADADWGAIYDLDYLKSGIEGGEGYDWYYADPEHMKAQIRTPITDGAYNEDWVWRAKDIRSWWGNDHHDRVGGVRIETPSDWVPQMKPIWFTELGCAAIDKGTNEPNKFLDPKSSESSLPRGSNGQRDDFIQMQYLRAMHEYWGDPALNPTSLEYDAPMIDMSHAHVWAWDARPYPFFPGNTEYWSDGANYARGHWLNGRSTNRALSDVVREICARSGLSLDAVETDQLYGIVRGFVVSDVDSARAALQPLMLAYGFEAIEREGKIIFRSRDGKSMRSLEVSQLALTAEQDSAVSHTRAPQAEVAGRVQLTFVEVDGDYGARAEEAIFPDEETLTIARTEMPLALTRAEGKQITERWLSEARVARDRAQFALPPSQLGAGAGDVVELTTDEGTALYRIDHASHTGAQMVEAVRVEPEIYQASDSTDEFPNIQPFAAPVPVFPLFLDLPLLTGVEVPYAPHVAASALAWPGSVAVYSSASDAGYELNRLLPAASIIGTTQTPLFKAQAGLWDRGPSVRVKIISGALASAEMEAVLNGANVAAIGDGSGANWEVFQFGDAVLVGERTYELSLRLRGQAGTDALGAEWPAGSLFVLLNGAPQQIDLAQSARGLARHYRIGPSQRPYDDPSYQHFIEAFDGIGLRPYAPAHLNAIRDSAGDLAVSWVRRTRIDGDSWQSLDVPLGETSEAYVLKVLQGGAVVRSENISSPAWVYTSAQQASDGIVGAFTIEVAQVSDTFGAGLYRKVEIDG